MCCLSRHITLSIIIFTIFFSSLFETLSSGLRETNQLHLFFQNNHSVFVFLSASHTSACRSAWLLNVVPDKENQENKPSKLTWIMNSWSIHQLENQWNYESLFSSVCIFYLTLLKNRHYTRHPHSKSIYKRWWDFDFSWWKIWNGILQPR